MSSLGPTLFGGSWTRLALADMALRTCIFDRVKSGKKPVMTFVVGGAGTIGSREPIESYEQAALVTTDHVVRPHQHRRTSRLPRAR